MTTTTLILVFLGAFAAIAYGAGLTAWILRQPAGNERMKTIQGAIQEGAAAYLNRQYMVIAAIGIVVAILLAIVVEPEHTGDPGHVLTAGLFLHRRRVFGRRRLRRYERGRACQRTCCPGGHHRSQSGHADGLPGWRRHRLLRGWSGPSRRRLLLYGLGPGQGSGSDSACGFGIRSEPHFRIRSAWAAASTPRPPTSARTWWARLRPGFPRTIRATRPSLRTTWATTSVMTPAWPRISSKPTS